jgi:hypothetical protein
MSTNETNSAAPPKPRWYCKGAKNILLLGRKITMWLRSAHMTVTAETFDRKWRIVAFSTLMTAAIMFGGPNGLAAPPGSKDDARTAAVDDSTADEWMMFYYKKPQPERFVAEVRKMSAAGHLANKNAEPPIVAFLSRVIAQNPEQLSTWMVALADLPEKDKEVIYEAIWYSNTKAGKAHLAEHGIAKYVQTAAPDILAMEINDAPVLDMLWGYFFATGEKAPIRRIVSAMNLGERKDMSDEHNATSKNENVDNKALKQVIRYSALWSLDCNCKDHPKVKEICEGLVKSNDLTATEAKSLKSILAKHQAAARHNKSDQSAGHWLEDAKKAPQNAWMKSDHGFGATLLFTDKPQQLMDNWAKPTAGVETPEAKTAPRGRPCGIFIVFAGCGAGKEGLADVVADLKVIAPGGKVYGEHKDVEVWQKKASPEGKQLQLSVGYMGLVIEPNDPAGEYEVRATVRDRVKGITLELKREFSVEK